MTGPSQLLRLARPFPPGFIKANQGSGGKPYIEQHTVNQYLLDILGPFNFSLVEVLRGDVRDRQGGKFTEASTLLLTGVVVGAVCRLTVVVDGRYVEVEEVGDCELPTNWATDGARLKDAMSDALKRCAMRLGLGLHLRIDDEEQYVLYNRLLQREQGGQASPEAGSTVQGAGADSNMGKVAVASVSQPAPHPAASGDHTPAGAGERAGGPAPDAAPAGNAPAAGAAQAGPAPATGQRKPRSRPAASKPAAAPAEAPPAGGAAGGAGGAHPAEQATTMTELCGALRIKVNSAWLRLRKAGQAEQIPNPARFAQLANLQDVIALDGPDFELAKAWLLDDAKVGVS